MSLAWKTFKRYHLWKTLFLVCLFLLVGSFFTDNYAFIITGKFTDFNKMTTFNGDQVKLDFYVMSQCPYGVQVETGVSPVLKELGDAVDYNVYFIGNVAGDSFQSLHGQPEVDENIRQICIQENDKDLYVDYLACLNQNYQNAEGMWEGCANEVGIDVLSLKSCFENEGKELLKASFAASNQVGATGSPTIYVNGNPYVGGRDALSFKKALCQGLDNHPACGDMPECTIDSDCIGEPSKIGVCDGGSCIYINPVKVEFTVLNDKTCSSCDPSQIIIASMNYFPGAVLNEVDISSDEGKALVEKYGIQVVPAYLMGQSIENTNMWLNEPSIQTAFEKTVDGYKLMDEVTGASRQIDPEARKAYYEKIGVTLEDNRPQIDFFVMSYCPYGNDAEEAIGPVYELLKDKADFNPYYVIYSNYGGGGPSYCMDEENKICSMHGIQELNQDLREVCVSNLLGMDEWFSFALEMNTKCNSQNADTCWQGVAESLGYDVSAIETCFNDDGLKIGTQNLELGTILGVSGSPTIFIDGEQYGGARTPDAIKQALCAAFDEAPEECSDVLETQASSVPAGSC
jgi:glutaredoxin